MLATPVSDPALPPGCAGEPKWDGFRALVSFDAGQVVLRSRRGTEMGPSFPEVVAGAVQLPDATALDGELVVWDAAGRLAFERLQNRLQRRGAGAARAAEEWPAHFVAFDLLRLSGMDTTSWPYRQRRAALESVFAARQLSAPWALCPSTTEADVVREWLTWASVGIEGVVFKRLNDTYHPSVRGWQKYKVRETSEAIVGAITGSPAVPRTLLLGRYDDQGRLQYVGRTTTLAYGLSDK
ncbi:ATP-dependent DNA ligase [Streptomyces pseudovenezuelae]|uniref:ATP-dependent DNA ligase n=1 Tax=Streptomyces pseudovenezuelae TaxID=67350 RepID=UPI002E81D7D6|nr:ATP-dependent DNA ligase [Streptomyces pseudovenezuelae]WUA85807.1 ATP-dependent DNA ligase [Streptomyces pseudovenezuelae]WUA93958.1 ATP-dependent DNA ligase [Streptomyces pseudovenezuelae]